MKINQTTLGICFLFLGVVLFAGVLVQFILPHAYGSSARIRIEKPVPPDRVYLQTEIEAIKSYPVLTQVIKNLNLGRIWAVKFKEPVDLGEEIIEAILKGMLEVRLHRNTSLIEIRVVSEDRQEAAAIANEIGKVYCEMANRTAKEIGVVLKASVLDPAQPAYRPIRNAPLRAGFYGVGAIVSIAIGALLCVRSMWTRTGVASSDRSSVKPPPLNYPPR